MKETGGRLKREGTYVYLWLIHVELWQKTTKFCKVIVPQLKNKQIFLKEIGLEISHFWEGKWTSRFMNSNELQISWLSRDVHKGTLESNCPKLKAKILFWKLPGFPGDSVVKKTHLSMQETWVRSLIQENRTCHGAIKPVPHNYWACALEPRSHNYWSPSTLEIMLCNRRIQCSNKPVHPS